MTPSEELVTKLMDEEVTALIKAGYMTAGFGSRASFNVAERVGVDPSRVHRLWLRTQLT